MRIYVFEMIFIFVFVILGVSGCSVVSSYNSLLLTEDTFPRQGAGAYNLQKHILVATVTEAKTNSYDLTVVRKAIPDPQYPLHVGINLSPTSDDDFSISYNNGLITKISSIVDDRSDDIIENLTKVFYSGVARSAKVKEGEGIKRVLKVEFDPFNISELEDANNKLSRLGYCIAFAANARHPFPAGCADRYGSVKDVVATSESSDLTNEKEVGRKRNAKAQKLPEGIFYRQPLNYKIRVYKFNAFQASCRNRWCTIEESFEAFANEGQILAVNVNRHLFVETRTAISFDTTGVPSSVRVIKPSEVLAGSNSILNITKAVFGAPISAVTTLDAEKENIKAKTALITAKTEYTKANTAMLEQGKIAPSSTHAGAILGNPGIIRTTNFYGNQDQVKRSGNNNSKYSRSQHTLWCSTVGLDQGGCEADWKKINLQ